MSRRPIPPATRLTRRQYQGWDCVFCSAALWRGAVLAGRARGNVGAAVLDIDVYACPRCVELHLPEANHSGGTA